MNTVYLIGLVALSLLVGGITEEIVFRINNSRDSKKCEVRAWNTGAMRMDTEKKK